MLCSALNGGAERGGGEGGRDGGRRREETRQMRSDGRKRTRHVETGESVGFASAASQEFFSLWIETSCSGLKGLSIPPSHSIPFRRPAGRPAAAKVMID